MRARCPHCGAWGIVSTSRPQSATVAHLYVICGNHECGHTWRASLVADVTLSPSSTPNPQVILPMASHIRRDQVVAHMQHSGTVEHRPELTPPTSLELDFSACGLAGPP